MLLVCSHKLIKPISKLQYICMYRFLSNNVPCSYRIWHTQSRNIFNFITRRLITRFLREIDRSFSSAINFDHWFAYSSNSRNDIFLYLVAKRTAKGLVRYPKRGFTINRMSRFARKDATKKLATTSRPAIVDVAWPTNLMNDDSRRRICCIWRFAIARRNAFYDDPQHIPGRSCRMLAPLHRSLRPVCTFARTRCPCWSQACVIDVGIQI